MLCFPQGLDTETPLMTLGDYTLYGTFIQDEGDSLVVHKSRDAGVIHSMLARGVTVTAEGEPAPLAR